MLLEISAEETDDAFLELCGKENEEKDRICEIKPIIITAVSFL